MLRSSLYPIIAVCQHTLIYSFQDSKLRVFTISMSATGMEQEQRNMAALLSKFRIGYSDVKVIPDIARKPRKDT